MRHCVYNETMMGHPGADAVIHDGGWVNGTGSNYCEWTYKSQQTQRG
jgi:hypothetical protein